MLLDLGVPEGLTWEEGGVLDARSQVAGRGMLVGDASRGPGGQERGGMVEIKHLPIAMAWEEAKTFISPRQ